MDHSDTRVVYVAGASFSGSTFFGSALGNHEDLVCAGELHNWLKTFIHKEWTGQKCACGEMLTECPFWKSVRNEWLKQTSLDLKKYQGHVQEFEKIRSLPFLFRQRVKVSSDFKEYKYGTKVLYDVIARISGKPIIIDISKRPARAFALDLVEGIDLSYIHLVRNGLAFITSTLKHVPSLQQTSRSRALLIMARASREWAFTNHVCDSLRSFTSKPYLRIKYEDFTNHPEETLQKVGGFIGLDLGALAARLMNGEPISFGHSTGNIIRTSGPAPLKIDKDWQKRLPPHARLVFNVFAGMTARKYGYSGKS